jgi:hypothetical protein
MCGRAFNVGDAVSISLGGLKMTRSRAVKRIGVSGVVFLLLAALLATPSAATVIRAGLGNDLPPGDDPGWANVGRRTGTVGSAVYLGDRWVLTAAHVGDGTVEFGGVAYGSEPGSWQPLHDPDDPGTPADLGLFRLDSAPVGLTGVNISQSAPLDTARVVGIGYGRDQASSETWWNSLWQKETGLEAYRGFELLGTFVKRWGENYIDGHPTLSSSGYTTHMLRTTFDQSGSADEMQSVPGDSGGGLFYKNDSDWELAGIFLLQGGHSGQPSLTAVYGNLTYAADLSRYEDQISAIVPEPSMLVMLLGVGMGCLVWSFWRRASR